MLALELQDVTSQELRVILEIIYTDDVSSPHAFESDLLFSVLGALEGMEGYGGRVEEVVEITLR